MIKTVLEKVRRDYLYTLGTGWLFIEVISFMINNWDITNVFIQGLLVVMAIILIIGFFSFAYMAFNKVMLKLMLKKNKKPYYLYDKFGNEVYFNNNRGYWFSHLYDANGNILVTYDSDNEWTVYEYYKNGTIKKMTDSHYNERFYPEVNE